MKTEIEQCARICHEVNKTYCESIGDNSQKSWNSTLVWQRNSAMNGVEFHLKNPDSTPEDSHVNWMKEKKETGWILGSVKDTIKKEHPCMIPYKDLPKEQQVKDSLFIAIVKTFFQNR